jgi:hypothetical protein
MAMNEQFDWRRYDRRLFAAVAVFFPLAVLLGFARTYYLRFAFDVPPFPSMLAHVHGALMTLWVLFFVSQVWLIRSKNHRIHMRLGFFGLGLAIAIVLVGFFTSVAGAKYPAPGTPPDFDRMGFLIIPLVDLVLFTILFGAAFIYRKRPAEHKRLILLTVLNFLPPAVGRFPFEPFISGGPPAFFGVPAVLAIVLVIYDTWRTGRLNRPFAAGAALLIASYPLRLMFGATDAWLAFANWLTTWAA